jgi:hypothetical protein
LIKNYWQHVHCEGYVFGDGAIVEGEKFGSKVYNINKRLQILHEEKS